MRYKLNKTIKAGIAAIADMLPVDYYEARTSVKTGAELLEENPEAVDGKGKKLDPDLKYTLPVKHQINHKNRLETAYKSGGEEAINKYLDKYRVKPAEEAQTELNDAK